MKPIEKLIQTIQGQNHGIPLFFPGIYDYKAAFSQTPIHFFGQDMDDFVAANQQEIEKIGADLVVCGYDIYNVEAEAIGCQVNRIPDRFPNIGVSLIDELDEIHRLPNIDKPQKRIALYIEAALKLHQKYRDRTVVMGAVSGPFSLAGMLYAKDKLFTDCMINPKGVQKLLQYCTDIINKVVSRYCMLNIPVVVFDSLAAPPLISPDIYRTIILPFHQQLFDTMTRQGMEVRPLIIGGDTRLIINDYSKSGANLMILDYTIPLDQLPQILSRYSCAFRINLSPQIIADGTAEEIKNHTQDVLKVIGSFPNSIIGTGILPVHTPLRNIFQVKNIIHQFYGGT